MDSYKIILITGGSKGLGFELTKFFAGRGHKIIVLDQNYFTETISEELSKYISFYKIDLSELKELENLIEEIIETFGQIDVLINNAAIKNFKFFDEFTSNEIYKINSVNFLVPVLLSNILINRIKENASFRIINISSASGFWGYRYGTLYCSTKGAIIRFTEALADDIEKNNKNITANVICPYSFSTIEGKSLPNYDYIVKNIIKWCVKIISSNVNGKVVYIGKPKNKIFEFVRSIKRFFQIIF